MTIKRPLLWAGVAGVPLLFATVFAYYLWVQVLIARGNGYIFNHGQFYHPFIRARIVLAVTVVVGAFVFELTRRQLPRAWRYCLFALLVCGITLLAVHWIVVAFGPAPAWHHP